MDAPSALLDELSTEEAAEVLKECRLGLLPVGSLEQHGPNLSLGVDSLIALGISRLIARELSPKAVVLPPIGFGISHHHMEFAGTVSISAETLQCVIIDVVSSLARHGVKRFLLVNGHGGNRGTLSVVLTRLRYECGLMAAGMFYRDLAADVFREMAVTEIYGHACEIETSVALYLAPQTVRSGALKRGDVTGFRFRNSGFGEGRVEFPYSWSEITRNGALGDATAASAEIGERIVSLAVKRTLEFLEEFLEAPDEAWGVSEVGKGN